MQLTLAKGALQMPCTDLDGNLLATVRFAQLSTSALTGLFVPLEPGAHGPHSFEQCQARADEAGSKARLARASRAAVQT